MDSEISELKRLKLIHPKVKEVINHILCTPNYNQMNLNQLDLLFIDEICKKYPYQYRFNSFFQQSINDILNIIHSSNIFNISQNSSLNFNGPNNNINNNNNNIINSNDNININNNNNIINNNNYGVFNNNSNSQNVNNVNTNIVLSGIKENVNNNNNENFRIYLQNQNDNSGNNSFQNNQNGNFPIYLKDQNNSLNNPQINNFNLNNNPNNPGFNNMNLSK